jgi:hypothetical protein
MHPLVAAVFLALVTQDKPSSVAIMVAVEGDVTIQPAKGTSRRAEVTDLLYPGDRIVVASQGGATLKYRNDLHLERVLPGSKVLIRSTGGSPPEAVRRIKVISRVMAEGVEEIGGSFRNGLIALSVFRGDQQPPAVPPAVIPMYGATVLDDRPTLSWRPAPGASSYEVRLIDALGRELWTAQTRCHHIAYDKARDALTRGRGCYWNVSARTEKGEMTVVTESRFFVAPASEARVLAELRPLSESMDPADLLVAAATYQAHGVHDEALALYERLSRLSPRDPFFHAIRSAYYRLAGRQDEARSELELARRLGYKGAGE